MVYLRYLIGVAWWTCACWLSSIYRNRCYLRYVLIWLALVAAWEPLAYSLTIYTKPLQIRKLSQSLNVYFQKYIIFIFQTTWVIGGENTWYYWWLVFCPEAGFIALRILGKWTNIGLPLPPIGCKSYTWLKFCLSARYANL